MPKSTEEDFQRFNAFLQYDSMATPLHRNRYPRGHEIYNFDRAFQAHHYYIFSLSEWPRPNTGTPVQGVEKFTILIENFHAHFY